MNKGPSYFFYFSSLDFLSFARRDYNTNTNNNNNGLTISSVLVGKMAGGRVFL